MVAGDGGSVQTVLSQTVYRNYFPILDPTLGIGVGNGICLHYTCTLSVAVCLLLNVSKERTAFMSRVQSMNCLITLKMKAVSFFETSGRN